MALIEKDQEVYVTSVSILGSNEEPTLTKFRVVDANKSSFYAIPADADEAYRRKRFSQRTLVHKDGFGYDYHAYRTEEEFWKLIERGKRSRALRKELKEQIDGMGLEKLEAITKYITLLK